MKKIIILIILNMFFVVGSVNAGNNEEIGVPIVENYISPYLSVLAPNKNQIYVLSQGFLTHYNLNPLKIISRTKVDFKIPPKEVTSGDETSKVKTRTGARIFITEDEKRLIVYTYKKIILFNVTQKKTEKTLMLGSLGNMGVLNGNEFVLFDDKNKITIFDASTLKKIKHILSPHHWAKLFKGDQYYSDTEPEVIGLNYFRNALNKLGGYIFLYKSNLPYFSDEFMIFDSLTYELIYIFKGVVEEVSIDYDLTTIYLREAGYVNGNPADKIFTEKYKGKYLGFGKKYNLKTKEIAQVTRQEKYTYFKDVIPLTREVEFLVDNSVAYRKIKSNFFYKGKSARKNFLQFYDGEAILFSFETKKFQVTSNARKHLKMKNSMGKMVPINDATFNQFNKNKINPMEW